MIFERTIRLENHPVLRSHVIGDKAVVPLVLHLEWLTHAALHGHPGLRFVGCDELRIFQGIQVAEEAAISIRVRAGKAVRADGRFVVPTEIEGTRAGRTIAHSRADVILADRYPEAPFAGPIPPTGPFTRSIDDVYATILFHGSLLRGLVRIDGMSEDGALAYAAAAPPPAEWMSNPERSTWLADPLVLDAAFQLLSVWSYQKHRAVSLPCFVGRYRQFGRAFPPGGVMIAVRMTRDTGSVLRADIDFIDSDGRLTARLEEVEHVIDASLNEAFRRGRLASSSAIGSTHLTRVGSRLP